MTIELKVDHGVPLLDDEPFEDLKVRVAAACETVNYLSAVDDTEHPHLETKASALDADLAGIRARPRESLEKNVSEAVSEDDPRLVSTH